MTCQWHKYFTKHTCIFRYEIYFIIMLLFCRGILLKYFYHYHYHYQLSISRELYLPSQYKLIFYQELSIISTKPHSRRPLIFRSNWLQPHHCCWYRWPQRRIRQRTRWYRVLKMWSWVECNWTRTIQRYAWKILFISHNRFTFCKFLTEIKSLHNG